MEFEDQSSYPTGEPGKEWPCLRQFCVFMENRVGYLHQLLKLLEKFDLRIIALSTVDSVDVAMSRIVLDNYERAREIFELSNYTFFEKDLIGVELPDDTQPYMSICLSLLQAEVNIDYTYPLLYRRHGRGAIALCVDDIDLGIKTLSEQGHRIITEKDLKDDDEYM